MTLKYKLKSVNYEIRSMTVKCEAWNAKCELQNFEQASMHTYIPKIEFTVHQQTFKGSNSYIVIVSFWLHSQKGSTL